MVTVLTCSADREHLFADEKRKSCWLPSDETSPWGYCRHCTFTQKNVVCDEIVRNLLAGQMEMRMPTGKNERIFDVVQASWFKDHCAHPASKVRLYHILLLLKTNRTQIYDEYIQNPKFLSSFISVIQTHRLSHENRLSCKLVCELAGKDVKRIPRQCPHCLYYLWNKNLENREYYTAFTNYLRSYETKSSRFLHPLPIFTQYIHHSLDKGEVGNAQTVYQLVLSHLQNDQQSFLDYLQDFLLEEGDTLSALIALNPQLLEKYRPHLIQQDTFWTSVILPAQRQWKQMLKAKCDAYKEDLMIKTCHPRRLFNWILDIEELKDFSEPFDESMLEDL